MSRPCKICAAPEEIRSRIDAELKMGTAVSTVAEVFAGQVGATGPSGFYRHGRHIDRRLAGGPFIDGTTRLGDVVADLARVRAALADEHAAAVRNGNSALLLKISRELTVVSSLLLKELGVDANEIVTSLAEGDRVVDGVHRGIFNRPEWGEELAAALEEIRDPGAASSIREAVKAARITQKENAA